MDFAHLVFTINAGVKIILKRARLVSKSKSPVVLNDDCLKSTPERLIAGARRVNLKWVTLRYHTHGIFFDLVRDLQVRTQNAVPV